MRKIEEGRKQRKQREEKGEGVSSGGNGVGNDSIERHIKKMGAKED